MKPKLLIGLLSVILTATSCSLLERNELPNFVVFLADDLGYGDLSCYGHPIIQTPNLDQFASEGVRLSDCHSAGTVCSPSRAGLLTGRNPYRSGFFYITSNRTYLHEEEITIPELLKQKNYQSGFFGKWHLSRIERDDHPDPADQGFDYYLATSVNAFDGPENPGKFIRNGEPTGTLNGWYCDIVVEQGIKWLKTIDPERPFFLEICTHEPHTPIGPPDSLYKPLMQPELISLIRNMKFGGVDREVPDTLLAAASYYATVQQVDNAFGVLMKELESLGLSDNTLVFFTSDNGPEHPVNLEESKGEWDVPIRDMCAGTPGVFRGMKRYPFEGGHRVPGIVRWPGEIPAGIVSDELFNGTDLLPVICGLIDIETPDDRPLDGINAFDVLKGKSLKRTEPVLWTCPTHEDTWFRMPHVSMRLGDLTLLGWLPVEKNEGKHVKWMKSNVPERFELYNLKNDPGQKDNLFSGTNPDCQDLTKIMIEKWIEIRDEFETI
jgi:arylsulfatase A